MTVPNICSTLSDVENFSTLICKEIDTRNRRELSIDDKSFSKSAGWLQKTICLTGSLVGAKCDSTSLLTCERFANYCLLNRCCKNIWSQDELAINSAHTRQNRRRCRICENTKHNQAYKHPYIFFVMWARRRSSNANLSYTCSSNLRPYIRHSIKWRYKHEYYNRQVLQLLSRTY